MAKRHPAKAYGRLTLYGSTRYSSKGSRKEFPRARTFGTRIAAGAVGSAIGSRIGSVGGPKGAIAGAVAGSLAGNYAGTRASVKMGTVRRTKQRMTLRSMNSGYGKADAHFHASRHHHTQGGMTH